MREWKQKPQTGKKSLQKTYDKGLLSKIYKEFLKVNNKKIHKMMKNVPKTFNRPFTKGDIKMANKYMKRCSISYVITEIQIKTTMSTSIRMSKIQNTDNTKCWYVCGATETHSFLVGMQDVTATLQNSLVLCYKHPLTILSNVHTPWYLPKVVENLRFTQTPAYIYSSFIHNCQNVEATKMSLSK
jgi:hypothetical protein